MCLHGVFRDKHNAVVQNLPKWRLSSTRLLPLKRLCLQGEDLARNSCRCFKAKRSFLYNVPCMHKGECSYMELYSVPATTLDGAAWWTEISGCFNSPKRAPVPTGGGRLGSTIGLDSFWRKGSLFPQPRTELRTVHPVANWNSSVYIDHSQMFQTKLGYRFTSV